jgi:glutamate-5-semialdehyde dehydrogenase
MADRLRASAGAVAEANAEDMKQAESEGLEPKLVARLDFGPEKIEQRAAVLEEIAELPSPLGFYEEHRSLSNGLRAGRMRTPLGVVAMVYEARAHVTLNAGALCLRSGNAAILKAGSEIGRTNAVLGKLWAVALETQGLPADAVQVLTAPGREVTAGLSEAAPHLDLVIPRGGKALIQAVASQPGVPVIKHFEGNCSVYVDHGADVAKAVRVIIDGKVLMPAVCNATESVVVHADAARAVLPGLKAAMDQHGVEVRACERSREIIPGAAPATDEDFGTEYLDMLLSVKMVDDLDTAIEHINHYGSHHTDVIVTPWAESIRRFTNEVDSGVVLSNASTMFCDGNTLGMGAEIGISTDKLHARGPMGMADLTTYKWVIEGDGHTMGDADWEGAS